jgi:hypothetical protein
MIGVEDPTIRRSAPRGPEQPSSRRPGKSLAQLERDAAFNRIGRARKMLIVAAAAGTALVAAVVSAVAPGRSLGARSRVTGAAARTAAPSTGASQMPPLASASQLGLQGPSQAPQSDQSQPPSDSSSSAAAQPSAPQSSAPQAPASQAAAPSSAPAPVSGGS